MKLYECSQCKEMKPQEEYHFRNDNGTYRKKCKICRRLNHYDYNLKRRYGITLQDKIQMFEDQGKCCKICRKEGEDHMGFHVDHCHDLGHVRGILCNECNAGLGMFKDNIDTVLKAVDYLFVDQSKTKVLKK